MSTLTPKGIPVPENTVDNFDPEGDLGAIAAWLEEHPGISTYTTAQRDVLVGADIWPGRTIYNSTTQRLEINRNGAAGAANWHPDGLPDAAVTTPKIAAGAVTADKLAAGVAPPAGAIQMYAGSAVPAGWLLCNGQAVSRETYTALFSAIGTTYGAGDEASTFNLPDLRDRLPIGTSAGKVRGSKGGAATATLLPENLPPHAHMISHDHGTVATTSDGTHSHAADSHGGSSTADLGGDVTIKRGETSGPGANFDGTGLIDSAGAHTHNVDLPNYVGSSGNGPGASTPVAVMNPWLSLDFIIKA